MKIFALVTLFLATFASDAFAQRRPDDRWPRPGNVRCEARDRGWEEHRQGHPNCGTCLRYHDRCVETCTRSAATCTAEGVGYRGRRMRFVGQGSNRMEAQREAMRRCEWNRNMRHCRVVSCGESRTRVSGRDCR